MENVVETAQEVMSTLDGDLTRTATKHTATYITDKIKQLKGGKDKDAIIRGYEELINSLLEDKSELERIARSYKELYEGVEISAENLEYLQNTIRSAIKILSNFGVQSQQNDIAMESLVQLISLDTLRTMQLLGFNYKKAIGEPLTELCADKIKSLGDSNNAKTTQKNRKR
ncbi:hypothetical protein [Sporosarcina sp. P29]|uniref:hypothetical protein n=1 Tax=Sporosarcina sp. P29 TaxID=2048252 RepID=UPI000C16BAE0|nr:hypothetical protein [Sporosarcina sp. P29]PIC98216.1 hypothetical protein CSV68_14265 [Sporosarcina sp. P29]